MRSRAWVPRGPSPPSASSASGSRWSSSSRLPWLPFFCRVQLGCDAALELDLREACHAECLDGHEVWRRSAEVADAAVFVEGLDDDDRGDRLRGADLVIFGRVERHPEHRAVAHGHLNPGWA